MRPCSRASEVSVATYLLVPRRLFGAGAPALEVNTATAVDTAAIGVAP
jgi:hypothetical protein